MVGPSRGLQELGRFGGGGVYPPVREYTEQTLQCDNVAVRSSAPGSRSPVLNGQRRCTRRSPPGARGRPR